MNPVLKRTLTGLTIGAIVIAAIVFAPPMAVVPVVAVLLALGVAEYVVLLKRKGMNIPLLLAGCIVLAIGLSSLAATALMYGNLMLLYMIAIVKFSDVGGFAFGLSSAKFMKGGNHKMCPTISPGKSWEGMFGSILFSTVVSCAFIGVTGFGVPKAIAFGVTAAIVGTAGDLVESKFKRWVGVKDSSAFKFTNGMGGILDMLDSLMFAPAVLLPFV